MSDPGENVNEESQEKRGAPGSRDTGSDEPSGGPSNRPSGEYKGDETVPNYGGEGQMPEGATKFTNSPPSDAKPATPPYEDRQTTAKPEGDSTKGSGGAEVGGAVKPVTDSDYKAKAPSETAGGATASPAQEQPASRAPETDRDDDMVDAPAHTPGTGRGEDKR
ncbi:MAG: hypothetical protein JWP55_2939 [Mycobacterium sp.]|jgi:hypothetical protein|nr:hypothetical protein [Mycobacterium sp.]